MGFDVPTDFIRLAVTIDEQREVSFQVRNFYQVLLPRHWIACTPRQIPQDRFDICMFTGKVFALFISFPSFQLSTYLVNGSIPLEKSGSHSHDRWDLTRTERKIQKDGQESWEDFLSIQFARLALSDAKEFLQRARNCRSNWHPSGHLGDRSIQNNSDVLQLKTVHDEGRSESCIRNDQNDELMNNLTVAGKPMHGLSQGRTCMSGSRD